MDLDGGNPAFSRAIPPAMVGITPLLRVVFFGSFLGSRKGTKMGPEMDPKRERNWIAKWNRKGNAKGDLNDILINNTNDESP